MIGTMRAFKFQSYIYILLIPITYLISGYCLGDTINIAMSNSPANLSPFFSYDSNSQNINRLVHLSLIDLDREMQVVCKACSRFSEKIDDNRHIIRFELRKNLLFWDGSKVTAEDIRKSVMYYKDTETIKSGFRFAFQKILEVRVIDKLTLELIYSKYDMDHLTDLTLLKIIKFQGDIISKSTAAIIGAGAYSLGENSDTRIILQQVNGRRKLVFKVVKDETTLALKLIKKEIDISLANISPRKLDWLKKNTSLKQQEVASSALQYVAFNEKRGLLADPKFRKVIGMIIPKAKIIKYKLKNSVIDATGFFPPSFPAYFNKTSDVSYDTKKAAQLMRDIGAVKKDGTWFYNKQKLSFKWLVVNNKNSIELVRIIKSYFNKFGIGLEVISQEWGSFYKNFKSGNYDILMSRWIGFTGPSILRLAFHSESIPPKGGNRILYRNSLVDSFIDKGLAEPRAQVRQLYIKKALDLIDRDSAYLYLWYPKIIWVMQSNISVDELYPNTSFEPLLNIRI